MTGENIYFFHVLSSFSLNVCYVGAVGCGEGERDRLWVRDERTAKPSRTLHCQTSEGAQYTALLRPLGGATRPRLYPARHTLGNVSVVSWLLRQQRAFLLLPSPRF